MSEVTVNKRHISLPWAVAVSVLMGTISGTGIYFTLAGRVDAAQQQSEVRDRLTVERFIQVERRIERVEETAHRTVILLERIDERTAEMKRRMDAPPVR
jgi:hypothetical protein